MADCSSIPASRSNLALCWVPSTERHVASSSPILGRRLRTHLVQAAKVGSCTKLQVSYSLDLSVQAPVNSSEMPVWWSIPCPLVRHGQPRTTESLPSDADGLSRPNSVGMGAT